MVRQSKVTEMGMWLHTVPENSIKGIRISIMIRQGQLVYKELYESMKINYLKDMIGMSLLNTDFLKDN